MALMFTDENIISNQHPPRPAVTVVDQMQFCFVPAGEFWMGEEDESGIYDLDQNYWLARYPVTVEQFRQYATDSVNKIGDDDRLKGELNTPVVWVSWHEAIGFCRWLTKRWRHEGWLPVDWQVVLPDEAQWEKAARGGSQKPIEVNIQSVQDTLFDVMKFGMTDNEIPRRKYPYGDEASVECSNFNNNVGTTSAVGSYSQGQSVYGCEELSGNVWEWTLSQYGKYPYPKWRSDEWMLRTDIDGDDSKNASRVLRGGAFNFNQRNVRCAVRGSAHPNPRSSYLGFRVCLSPLPLADEPLNDGTLKQ